MLCVPCECAGSIKYIHVECLQEWIREKKSVFCELCGHEYRKKYKLWAMKNKIIGEPSTNIKMAQKVIRVMEVLQVVLVVLFLLCILWKLAIDQIEMKNGISKTEEYLISFLLFFFWYSFVLGILQFHQESDYLADASLRINNLFPHLTNLEWIKDINLPIKLVKSR